MKTQLAETAKKNEFKSYLGQHVRKVAKLADVNKDIVVLGHEGEKKKKKKQSTDSNDTTKTRNSLPTFSWS